MTEHPILFSAPMIRAILDGRKTQTRRIVAGSPSRDWTRPRPSIHMPRWASRITLRITDVRVERLQAITEDDAAAEGCSTTVEADGSVTCGRRKSQFRNLWDILNAKRGAGWDMNPWCWVIEFERVEPKP